MLLLRSNVELEFWNEIFCFHVQLDCLFKYDEKGIVVQLVLKRKGH